jgi:hypothetical protein
MSATLLATSASFRLQQQALAEERADLSAVAWGLFSMDTVRDVRAVLAGALKGASALYISFASFTKFGPDALFEAAIAAKKPTRPLFTYLRPRLPESALDIDSPAFQIFMKVLPYVDILQLTSEELFYFCPDAFDPADASAQICQRFNLKALVVFDEMEGSGFVANREMTEPSRFTCRRAPFGNLEEVEGQPSRFSRHIIYDFAERGGVKALPSSRELTTIVKGAADSVGNSEPTFVN